MNHYLWRDLDNWTEEWTTTLTSESSSSSLLSTRWNRRAEEEETYPFSLSCMTLANREMILQPSNSRTSTRGLRILQVLWLLALQTEWHQPITWCSSFRKLWHTSFSTITWINSYNTFSTSLLSLFCNWFYFSWEPEVYIKEEILYKPPCLYIYTLKVRKRACKRHLSPKT